MGAPSGRGDGASRGASALTVLGAGTLLPSAERSSAAFFVEAPGLRLLLDCGPGTLHGLARHGIAWQAITHVALSHTHLDHVGDLPALLFALKHGPVPPRTRPLVVVGPRGFGRYLERLSGALGDWVVDPGFALDVVELEGGAPLEEPVSRMILRAHATPHTDASLAYRVELPAGAVGYTGDTGPSDGVADFLSGCHVLVAECGQADPPTLDTHLSPRTLAELARRAEPGVLVVTHVTPPLTPAGAVAGIVGAGYRGRVVAGEDGMRLEVRRSDG